MSHDFNPVLVNDLGFTWALKYLFDELRTRYKILSHFIKIDDVDGIYELNVESNIYRIFQEILTNIGKHAEATRISVIVKRQNNRVSFTVRDNGRGLQRLGSFSQTARRTRHRLGIHARACEDGGRNDGYLEPKRCLHQNTFHRSFQNEVIKLTSPIARVFMQFILAKATGGTMHKKYGVYR